MISARAPKYQKLKALDLPPPLQVLPSLTEQPHCLDTLSLAERFEDLKQFGYNTHSFLSLYGGLTYFTVPEVVGYIPIIKTLGLILISGEPVCSSQAMAPLVTALEAYAKEEECSIGAIPVSEKSKKALEAVGFDSIYIGKEPIFDLQNLPKLRKSLRSAANRTSRKGYKVVPYGPSYQEQLEALCGEWQEARELPPLEFLFQLRPLELMQHKKYFLLVDESDKLCAFLACSPIYARNGWYLEDLIRHPDAANGCTEFLLIKALESLAAEGYAMATLALAPLAGLPDKDETHPILNAILRLCYRHLSWLYHFQTLEYFKGKFQPSHWENNYFCVYRRGQRFGVTCSLLRSLMPRDILTIIKHKLEKRHLLR
ncbi:MAG: DUF2156 domain-containing protein [Candidatus Obscuribacterales bacterium]|jgi:lysylphosphatidylglycerol synthetase-like protein (DUF2156 family)